MAAALQGLQPLLPQPFRRKGWLFARGRGLFGGLLGSLRLAGALGLGRGLARLGAVGQDLGDPHQRKLLAVAALPARILAAPLLEGDYLRATALLDHLGGDRSPRHGWGAERGGIATHDQNLPE